MLEKNINKLETDVLIQKIKNNFLIKHDFSLIENDDELKIEFTSSEDFWLLINMILASDIKCKKAVITANKCFFILSSESVPVFNDLIEKKTNNTNPTYIQLLDNSASFFITSPENLNNNYNDNSTPLILALPLEIIVYIMNHLDYEDAIYLTLSLVSSYYKHRDNIEDMSKHNTLVEFAREYRNLFITCNKKIDILVAPGIIYFQGIGTYAWGNNYYAQLGLNNTQVPSTPQKINFFQNRKLIALQSEDYTLAITYSNEVYGWGNNKHGQLGLGDFINRPTIQHIKKLQRKKIVNIAIGDQGHSLFLTEKGEVYGCGKHSFGQLGLGDANVLQKIPQLIKYFKDKIIVAIAAGSNHSLFLTKEGEVYSCGHNGEGQLGLGDTRDRNTPQLIVSLSGKKIIAIATYLDHCICVTESFVVFAFGANRVGQLGLGHNKNEPETEPQPISFFKDKKIKDIATGGSHSLFLSTNYEVYSTGSNRCGQLGLGDFKNRDIPEKIQRLDDKKIVKIIAGGLNSFFKSKNNEIFSCGNVANEITYLVKKKVASPKKIDLPFPKENDTGEKTRQNLFKK